MIPRTFRDSLNEIWHTMYHTIRIYGEIEGEQRAASFAYYVLFALFPLFALLLTLGSAFSNPQDVIHFFQGFLPIDDTQQKFIWDAVHNLEKARGGVGLISIVILLWCSLRFFQALVHGVNRAWHTVEIPWWQTPLKNLLMIAIMGSALLAALLAPALLQGVRDALLAAENFIHVHFPTLNLHLLSSILDLGRYFVGGAVLFYCFTMLYMLSPRRKVYFSQVWLPTLIVTLALQACQISFVNYLPRFVNYGIYGAVGGMMLLLLWVYFSGMIIILGGCLCAARAQVLEEKKGAEPIPSSSAG